VNCFIVLLSECLRHI